MRDTSDANRARAVELQQLQAYLQFHKQSRAVRRNLTLVADMIAVLRRQGDDGYTGKRYKPEE